MLRLYVEESPNVFQVRRRFSKQASAEKFAKERITGRAYITDDSFTTKNRLGHEVPIEKPVWVQKINVG